MEAAADGLEEPNVAALPTLAVESFELRPLLYGFCVIRAAFIESPKVADRSTVFSAFLTGFGESAFE